jgi:hypothetical protein
MKVRTEFGLARTECACPHCTQFCLFMPGFLVPSDLERMVPAGADPLAWAETNLLASPGALVMQGRHLFRIPTLVPAVRADGSCINFDGACTIHAIAPFGCAFPSCSDPPEFEAAAAEALRTILCEHSDHATLYARVWNHLWDIGRRQLPPEELRKRERTQP